MGLMVKLNKSVEYGQEVLIDFTDSLLELGLWDENLDYKLYISLRRYWNVESE